MREQRSYDAGVREEPVREEPVREEPVREEPNEMIRWRSRFVKAALVSATPDAPWQDAPS
jgi:hypothetical protein